MEYTEEEHKAGFARLKKEIQRQERVALFKKRAWWAAVVIAVTLLFYYAW